MSDHDPQHGTASWLVFCLCAIGSLLLGGVLGLKYAQQRQIARFRELAPTLDYRQVMKSFGKPDRVRGSGFMRYEYDILGGGIVTMVFGGSHPSYISYDGEVLFERISPTPISPYTHSIPTNPIPPSPEGLRTLQSKPPPKKAIPEP